jgi:hypothetical protein
MSITAILRHLLRFRIYYITGTILVLTIYLLSRLSVSSTFQPKLISNNYVYEQFAADNGISLHIVRTEPENIHLQFIDNNVSATDIVGVNGGFFWEKQLLSIAVHNDQPVIGTRGALGTGWFNAKYARGTLVYDANADKFSVQVANDAGQLIVTDRSQYWAQGGISMNLRDDDGWRVQAELEAIPVPYDQRLRSAMSYDEAGRVYLIVTDVKCTAADFRQAILAYGDGEKHRLIDGIFLDGDGSSQLSTREAKLTGDGRPVLQMIGVD